MSYKINIEIFPKRFQTKEVKKLYSNIEYFSLKIDNKIPQNYNENRPFYSFKLIPEYFKLTLRNTNYKERSIWQYNWGYSILLNKVNTIDDYMNLQFNGKKRSIIKRYVNRLEKCFNISYKMFYGNIDKENYTFLMNSLKKMIVERFEERNETHKNMQEWDLLVKNSFSEIINKHASLFIIYNEDEPIEISLNYHYNHVLFSYVSSYNIEYSKFGLGHVEIYKQIEWCLNNKYILFEMGVGGMDYKRRWSNNIYRYKQYFIYKNTTQFQKIKTYLKIVKSKFKEYLKSKSVNEILPKTGSFFVKSKKVTQSIEKLEIKKIDDQLNTNNMKELDFNTKEYQYIKKHIYTFLYATTEHIYDVKLYNTCNKNTFLIKGKNNYQNFIKQ